MSTNKNAKRIFFRTRLAGSKFHMEKYQNWPGKFGRSWTKQILLPYIKAYSKSLNNKDGNKDH